MSKRQFGTVRRLRSGRWQARYRGAGGMVTAPHTFTTKAEASRYLAVVETDMARGIFVDPRAGRITLREWVDEWLRGNPAKRATTRARDELSCAPTSCRAWANDRWPA